MRGSAPSRRSAERVEFLDDELGNAAELFSLSQEVWQTRKYRSVER
jgi:hypothetical protein